MAFEDNFLYPLVLLLIGGAISGVLIPFFNRLHEAKLRKIEQQREEIQKRIEQQREEIQKRINREREDYRFELEIKDRLFDKISEMTNLVMATASDMVVNPTQKIRDRLQDEFEKKIDEIFHAIINLIVLYFNDDGVLRDKTTRIYGIGHSSIAMCSEPDGSNYRKKILDELNDEYGIKLDEEQTKVAISGESIPQPIIDLKDDERKLNLMILKKKVNLPHSS